MAVSSLFDTALQAVMRDFPHHEGALSRLPSLVKTKLARIMAKRGVLREENMALVLHDGVLDLDLSECSISGHGLGYVTSLCPRLRKVDLNAPQGCRNDISSHDFRHFFTRCTRLQVVSLRCCVLLDNSAVLCLVQNCPMLTSLCVGGCHMISDRSLMAIGQKCRYLQVLDLTRTKVSTEGLSALANGVCAKVLRELNVSHCLNVTDEGIHSVVVCCPRLSILVLHSCPLLTPHSRDITTRANLKQLTWTIY